MEVHKCDRCGKIIENYREPSIIVRKNYYQGSFPCQDHIEFCDKCYSDFKKFLKNKL